MTVYNKMSTPPLQTRQRRSLRSRGEAGAGGKGSETWRGAKDPGLGLGLLLARCRPEGLGVGCFP